MHGEPDRRPVGPGNAMAAMRGDQQVIPWSQAAEGILALHFKFRRALQHDDPFVLRLIVAEARRTRLTVRNDALDPDSLSRQERIEPLAIARRCGIPEEVLCHGQAALARSERRSGIPTKRIEELAPISLGHRMPLDAVALRPTSFGHVMGAE